MTLDEIIDILEAGEGMSDATLDELPALLAEAVRVIAHKSTLAYFLMKADEVLGP